MYKLGLEKAEEPEIKLPTITVSWRKQENSRKTSASLTMGKPLTVWITTNWKILKEKGIPDHLTCMWVKKQQLEPDMEQQTQKLIKIGKNMTRLHIVTLFI